MKINTGYPPKVEEIFKRYHFLNKGYNYSQIFELKEF